MKKNIIVIGVGKRSRNDILPAIQASEAFTIVGVYARSDRMMALGDKTYHVEALDTLDASRFESVDWIYLGVPVHTIASVLQFLSRLPVHNIRLIIDTPVFPWRYILAQKYFKYFAEVVVAEDAVYLPWIDPLKKVLGGKIDKMVFDQSSYAYHGIALIKVLAECQNFPMARMVTREGKKVIELRSPQGTSTVIIEPRDYAQGTMTFSGPLGTISDSKPFTQTSMFPIVSNGVCVGVQVGPERVDFSEAQTKLIGEVPQDATLTSLTLQLKRVSLVTMLIGLAEGRDVGWHVQSALADTRLDELVRHIGKYINVGWMVR